MAIIGPKPWVNAFEKCQFLDFLNILFLQPRKAFFVLEYRKRNCPGLYCPKKKNWKYIQEIQPRKMFFMIFQNKKTPFYDIKTRSSKKSYSLERRFFVLEYQKRHFPGLYFLKKTSWKTCHFYTTTISFKKMSIFRLFDLLLFIA